MFHTFNFFTIHPLFLFNLPALRPITYLRQVPNYPVIQSNMPTTTFRTFSNRNLSDKATLLTFTVRHIESQILTSILCCVRKNLLILLLVKML